MLEPFRENASYMPAETMSYHGNSPMPADPYHTSFPYRQNPGRCEDVVRDRTQVWTEPPQLDYTQPDPRLLDWIKEGHNVEPDGEDVRTGECQEESGIEEVDETGRGNA